ncbi:nucleotidyltransferase domain-containing protein [Candidatus Gottesmanbacteria bacterium]|nr:nucleotidyltransferase domain-containing protein [Candidatus Gottesmanbacteria bacterium]
MLDQQTRSILTAVIHKYLDDSKYRAFLFGSRTQAKHRTFCDVDVGIMGATVLPASTLLQIKEDLSNSDIPYVCDVVDFGAVSADFREKALSHTLSL